ncbi:aspartate aminotransferase family protein [Natronococcus sp. A-GB1]|uniref:aspartate aminotransferase family protein n=1 Tax=Natronococcus sp. A-GB1 TaxID=3037648 RepID=UPI00241D320F|nr:aspartate aminotransferase family protein [Natronococcus sp. A-GB1]MDG5762094.1 aspartate aminotransferase family protein [Natronococcus sp. A-GB1]
MSGDSVDPYDRYRDRTPASAELSERAKRVLPGGDTRSVTYHGPYPSFFTEASGARVTTADGETLLDFLNNYTQSVLGHAPEAPVEAACDRLQHGNDVAAPNEDIVELAERLVDRISSVEQVRFGNSGTEGTMNAIRGAMAWTERDRILKVEGGYHGTHDTVEVAVGDESAHEGIPDSVEKRVDAVPFNDTEALKNRFERAGEEYACFILEPIMGVGGMIPAEESYLETARDLTAAADSLLLFDEVMSFRLAPGGAQERYGVEPDLTALGKLIGGGLPIGAFGGREDVMSQFHPETGGLKHSGTFNGNPATMAAGAALLDQYDADRIEALNERGDRFRERLQGIGDESDRPVRITGDGSLFQIHVTDEPVTDYESSTAGEPPLEDLFIRMRNDGILLAPRGMGNLSTAIEDEHTDTFLDAFEEAIDHIPEADSTTAV